jgi:hypothetical protein
MLSSSHENVAPVSSSKYNLDHDSCLPMGIDFISQDFGITVLHSMNCFQMHGNFCCLIVLSICVNMEPLGER